MFRSKYIRTRSHVWCGLNSNRLGSWRALDSSHRRLFTGSCAIIARSQFGDGSAQADFVADRQSQILEVGIAEIAHQTEGDTILLKGRDVLFAADGLQPTSDIVHTRTCAPICITLDYLLFINKMRRMPSCSTAGVAIDQKRLMVKIHHRVR